MKKSAQNIFETLPIFILGALVSIGSYWSFTKGGNDFAVFYQAWKLVLEGKGTQLYINSPDRFLYAPGFAWVLSPLAFFPKAFALAIWNLAKALVIYGLVQILGRMIFDESKKSSRPIDSRRAIAYAAGGFLLISRPLLIDFQYGQVNLFILGACVWALQTVIARKPQAALIGSSWFILGVAAVSKLFAVPLLFVPYFRAKTDKTARLASAVGVLVAISIPMTTLGFSGAFESILAWRQALIAKGLPFESHNQSFIALLDHYFTNTPTHVIALGWNWVVLGRPVLGMDTITRLAVAWSFLFMGILAAWILVPRRADTLRWLAVLTGLLFVPSYLVWKPYFVLSYPLATLILWRYGHSKKWLIALGFVAMNLTGFDLVGGFWAARLEAASIFLWVHLAYLACAFWARPDFEIRTSPEHIDLIA